MTETVITVNSGPHAQSQQRPASDLGWIQFNVNYFLTYPGILKLIQLVIRNAYWGLEDRKWFRVTGGGLISQCGICE